MIYYNDSKKPFFSFYFKISEMDMNLTAAGSHSYLGAVGVVSFLSTDELGHGCTHKTADGRRNAQIPLDG